MSIIQQLSILAAVIVVGVSALGAGVAYWAHRQNDERSSDHRARR